jgi:hypothetical protein
VYYVDYAKGSDSNDGSIGAPFKTIATAVAKAAGQVATINLRAGTHYVAQTIQITPDNSGLVIQNYQGEAATVSGGVQIMPDWKPYNVTPSPPSPPSPPPAPGWQNFSGMNYVYGCSIDNQTFFLLGKPSNWQDCQTLCQNFKGCHAYTWHDQQQSGFELWCIGRVDGEVVGRGCL